jgi:MYXO-CTERM domain-containing protein
MRIQTNGHARYGVKRLATPLLGLLLLFFRRRRRFLSLLGLRLWSGSRSRL